MPRAETILDPLEQLARRLDELEWYLREVHQITPAQIRDLRNRKERREIQVKEA